MNHLILTYLIYLTLSLLLTVWVARTLHSNGRVFLVKAFHDDEALADSVNNLLRVGFYLVNLGFVSFHLKHAQAIDTPQALMETLAAKLGVVLLVLGGMHFFNLYVLARYKRKAEQQAHRLPPVAPEAFLDRIRQAQAAAATEAQA
jgi:hypothetical protein